MFFLKLRIFNKTVAYISCCWFYSVWELFSQLSLELRSWAMSCLIYGQIVCFFELTCSIPLSFFIWRHYLVACDFLWFCPVSLLYALIFSLENGFLFCTIGKHLKMMFMLHHLFRHRLFTTEHCIPALEQGGF